MENRINGKLPNTTFLIRKSEAGQYLIVQYIGLKLGFQESQWIKYYLFRWKPFLERVGSLIFDLPDYCEVDEAGWRMFLLIRRWLNYADQEVFLSARNQSVEQWKTKYGMKRFFGIMELYRGG